VFDYLLMSFLYFTVYFGLLYFQNFLKVCNLYISWHRKAFHMSDYSVFTTLHGMPAWTSYEKVVRPSICLSVHLIDLSRFFLKVCNSYISWHRKAFHMLYHSKDHLA